MHRGVAGHGGGVEVEVGGVWCCRGGGGGGSCGGD